MGQATVSNALAILQIDLVGYSRLVGSDDEVVFRQIDEEMAAVRGILERSGGEIRSRAGDSYLATFPTVRGAMAAAFGIQGRIAEDRSQSPLIFRIGVHVGDVFLSGDEVMGNAVNIAARLEGIADPGGICISRAARDLAAPAVRQRFGRQGEVQLKNIDEPVEVFKSNLDGKIPAAARADFQTVASNTTLAL